MVLTHEQKRVRDLLTETVTLLCKNGLQFKSEIGIEALIGITLDRDEVFLVSIKETISSNDEVLEDSLVGLDSADRAVDDEEYVAASHMVDYKTGENKNKFVQRRSKVRKGLQNSCDGSDIQMINPDVGDKVLVFASETKDLKHTSEILAQNESVRSLQHSSTSRGSGNMSYSSDIDMKNTFAVASGSCSKSASRIRNEATDSGNFAAESHLSGDSGIIQIKHENAEEQFIPYMELDSLCASSADDLSDLSWRPDHEGSHLLPHNSGDPCFPQRKRRQVAVVPGSKVCIEASELEEMEKQASGTKLIRRLAHAIFPDYRKLAFSCCLGTGSLSGNNKLDPEKVDAIIKYVELNMPHISKQKVIRVINNLCSEARRKLLCRRR